MDRAGTSQAERVRLGNMALAEAGYPNTLSIGRDGYPRVSWTVPAEVAHRAAELVSIQLGEAPICFDCFESNDAETMLACRKGECRAQR